MPFGNVSATQSHSSSLTSQQSGIGVSLPSSQNQLGSANAAPSALSNEVPVVTTPIVPPPHVIHQKAVRTALEKQLPAKFKRLGSVVTKNPSFFNTKQDSSLFRSDRGRWPQLFDLNRTGKPIFFNSTDKARYFEANKKLREVPLQFRSQKRIQEFQKWLKEQGAQGRVTSYFKVAANGPNSD